MTVALEADLRGRRLPGWLPAGTRNYLFHTEKGVSIRALARRLDCAPSTVLRQVRRVESRRDDPLVDAALDHLAERLQPGEGAAMKTRAMTSGRRLGSLTEGQIEAEARGVLHALTRRGAVLAVAQGMEVAVVVAGDGAGGQTRLAQCGQEIAQALAVKDWIASADPSATIARYHLTNTGRAALRQLVARAENKAQGLKVGSGEDRWDISAIEAPGRERQPGQECPLDMLARRRDADGRLFLSAALLGAGRRLGEDFALAGLPMDGVETGEEAVAWIDGQTGALPRGIEVARGRVRDALVALGPGLGDVALRCCCLHLGLEQTEREMGWSARSGKVVLRIALTQLERHYEERFGAYGPLIG